MVTQQQPAGNSFLALTYIKTTCKDLKNCCMVCLSQLFYKVTGIQGTMVHPEWVSGDIGVFRHSLPKACEHLIFIQELVLTSGDWGQIPWCTLRGSSAVLVNSSDPSSWCSGINKLKLISSY